MIKEARRTAWLREKMVTEQLVARGITDERVLAAMRKVPRHMFVSPSQRMDAYIDRPLSIGEGQTISQPYMVALMTEALKLKGTETVLEIGTGSGYQAAVLAEISARVYSVERIPSLAGKARKTLDEMGYGNVLVKLADGTMGWKEFEPYDRIMVTAGAPSVPQPLVEQLKVGGFLVIPVGSEMLQQLTRVTRFEDGTTREEHLGGCVFVRLLGRYGWEVNGR